MLKRFWMLCAALLILAPLGLRAQADLTDEIQLIRGEKFDEATAGLNDLLKEKQKNEDEIYYWLGLIDYQRESYASASENFRKALSADKKSPYALAGMARIAFLEERLADANEYLLEALNRLKGKDPQAHFAVAEAFLMGGPSEIGEAKKILYVAREDFPENPRSHILLADYYKAQGVPSLAIEEYEIAKKKAPEYVPSYASLAELKYEEGLETGVGTTLQEGLNNANKAIELNPNFAPAYRIRGELWLLAKEYQRARDDLQKYVQLTDSDLGARIRYASFLFLSENYQEAIDEIAAIEQDTLTNVMLRLKSMSLNKLGNSEQAQQTMDTYFDRVKKEEYILWQDYDTYGDIMRTMGDLETADEYYAKAITKNSARSKKYEELAGSYRSAGRALDKEIRAIKKEMVSDTKIANNFIAKGNEAVRSEDAETAKAMFAKRDSLLAEIEAAQAEIAEKQAAAMAEYELEAHYRQLALDMADPVELTHHYRLGMAHYNAENYKIADKVFIQASELKQDWETPYQYRMQCAYYLEQADTSSNEWLARDVAEDVIEVWGDKDPESLSKDAKQLVLVSYEVMANYNFNPTGEDGNYNCEDANPWIEKIYAIDPDYSRIQGLADYCESLNRR